MMGFSCQHRSASLRIFLVSVVLLLTAPAGRCHCYKRIFSFGDSIIDTGNFARSGPIMEYPFGMTYFHHPTGRISDGRVLVDFYGEYTPTTISLCKCIHDERNVCYPHSIH
jgi:hypothetical protein